MSGWPIWYELMCSDVAAVREFYRAVIGWDIPAAGQTMPNGSEYRIIQRADGGSIGGVLTINPGMAEMHTTSAWLPYFHAADVDALATQASTAGAAIHMAPMTMPGAGRMAMLSDPQGATFYVMTPEPPPGQPDAKSDVFAVEDAGHCRWNELNTSDGPGATTFYTDLFDWKRGGGMPIPGVGDYQFIEMDGVGIGAINPMLAPGTEPHWLPVFGVVEIEAAKVEFMANGGTLAMDTSEIPGGEFVFYGSDPSGAAVAFVGPKGS